MKIKFRFLHKDKSERGFALPAVLVVLALGSAVVGSSLSYANTIVNDRVLADQRVNRLYAADAGVEDVLLSLKNGTPTHSTLPQDINNAHVTMQVENKGFYAYLGDRINLCVHAEWLVINSSLVWDSEASAYKYTITFVPGEYTAGNIELFEIGVRLPEGYSYLSGSAASFPDNLNKSNPTIRIDACNYPILRWVLPPPRPKLTSKSTIQTQTFYITGEGALKDNFAWVIAQSDIGVISELDGDFYIVTSTATSPDGKTTTIVADVMLVYYTEGNRIYVISWRTSP